MNNKNVTTNNFKKPTLPGLVNPTNNESENSSFGKILYPDLSDDNKIEEDSNATAIVDNKPLKIDTRYKGEELREDTINNFRKIININPQ